MLHCFFPVVVVFASNTPTQKKNWYSSPRTVLRERDRHMSPTPEYKWMSFRSAAAWEEEADRLGVSKVARGLDHGKPAFMRAYEAAGSAAKMKRTTVRQGRDQTWGRRRHNFVKRTMAQYTKRGGSTYRRWLSLVMWAYSPPGDVPEDTSRRSAKRSHKNAARGQRL